MGGEGELRTLRWSSLVASLLDNFVAGRQCPSRRSGRLHSMVRANPGEQENGSGGQQNGESKPKEVQMTWKLRSVDLPPHALLRWFVKVRALFGATRRFSRTRRQIQFQKDYLLKGDSSSFVRGRTYHTISLFAPPRPHV